MVLAKNEVLTRKRIKAGYTKSELAGKIGTNHSVICRAESGGSVSPKTAKAICDALGDEFDNLFLIKNERR